MKLFTFLVALSIVANSEADNSTVANSTDIVINGTSYIPWYVGREVPGGWV